MNTHARTHARTRARTHGRTHARTRRPTHPPTFARTHAPTHPHTQTQTRRCTRTPAHAHALAHAHTHAHAHAPAHVHARARARARLHAHMPTPMRRRARTSRRTGTGTRTRTRDVAVPTSTTLRCTIRQTYRHRRRSFSALGDHVPAINVASKQLIKPGARQARTLASHKCAGPATLNPSTSSPQPKCELRSLPRSVFFLEYVPFAGCQGQASGRADTPEGALWRSAVVETTGTLCFQKGKPCKWCVYMSFPLNSQGVPSFTTQILVLYKDALHPNGPRCHLLA